MAVKFSQEDEYLLLEEFKRWWSLWPPGTKKSVSKAREAWMKSFGETERELWEPRFKVMSDAVNAQKKWRAAVLKKYPTQDAQRRAGVFLPAWKHQSTWINGGCEHDDIPHMPGDLVEVSSVSTPCVVCSSQGVVAVGEHHYCASCWSRKFGGDSYEVLRQTARRLGLTRGEGETNRSIAERSIQKLNEMTGGFATLAKSISKAESR